MSITLSQLAELVGRSKTQVSHALTGRGRVSPELVKEVHRIARKHGYMPHGPARALRRGRKDAYAVLWVGDYPGEFDNLIASGVQAWLDEHAPRHLILTRAKEPTGEISRAVTENWVDGVILANTALPDVAEYRDEIPLPTVVVNHHANALSSVSCDDQKAAQTAVEHLVRLGHRRIAYVYVSKHPSGHRHSSIAARLKGYRSACRQRGLVPHEYPDGAPSLEKDIVRLRHSSERPTAILCYSDHDSLAVFNVLARRGIRVPDEVSIMGFDDSHVCECAFVPLSTMKIPFKEMGRHACRLLEERIENPALPLEHVVLDARLIERASTAPPTEPTPRTRSSRTQNAER